MSGHPPSSPLDRDHLCCVRSPSIITCGQRPPSSFAMLGPLRHHLWTDTSFAMLGPPPSSPVDRYLFCYVRSPSVITCGQRQPPSSSVDRDSLHHHLWTETASITISGQTASIIICGQRQPLSSSVDRDSLHHHL